MKKLLFVFALFASPLFAQTAAIQQHCFVGGTQAQLSGMGSTNFQQGIIPSCTVTVFLTGTQTLAPIFADISGTVLSNPFTANSSVASDPGGFIFWAATNQGYDVVMSGGIAPNTYAQPITLTGVYPSFQFTGGGGASPAGPDAAIQTRDGSALAGPGPTINKVTGNLKLVGISGKLSNRSDIVDMVADCGLPTDGVTDSTPAINACLTAHGGGVTYKFPNLTFREASTPNIIPFGATVEGTSYSFNNGSGPSLGTILKADVGVTNLIAFTNVHISKINIAGSEPSQLGAAGDWAKQILPVGSCLQSYTEAVNMTRTGGVVTATSTLQAAYKPNGIIRITGAADTSFNGDFYLDTDTSTGTVETLTWAQAGAANVGVAVAGTIQPGTTGTSCSDGIVVAGTNVVIDHVSSYDHGRSGIRISPTGINDDFSITDSFLFRNRAHGLEVANGDDTSAGTTNHILIYLNQLFGISDINFLGNKHDSPQATGNHTGAGNPVASGTFAISGITRTGGVVTVNFSVDTGFVVGLPITVTGVTDASFNLSRATSISGFVSSVSAGGGVNRTVTFNSPIFGQADASSSGGTAIVPDQAHFFLGSAIFGGCYYLGGKFFGGNDVLMKNYCEGGQGADNGGNSIFTNMTVLSIQTHSGDGTDPNWMGSSITSDANNGLMLTSTAPGIKFKGGLFHFQLPAGSTDILTLSATSLTAGPAISMIAGLGMFASGPRDGSAVAGIPSTISLQEFNGNTGEVKSTSNSATPGRLQLIGKTNVPSEITYLDCLSTGCTFSVPVAMMAGNVTVALPTTAIAANTCTAPATVSMPGVGATQTVLITSWQMASNVATFTASNTLVVGQAVTLSGFGTSTFFNGQQVIVIPLGLGSGQFEANFTHANGSVATQTVSITAWSITSNVATFTATNTLVAGQPVTLSGFGTSTFFNGQTANVIAAGLSGTQFEVNFTHANGSATEAGIGTFSAEVGTGNAVGSSFSWSQTGNPTAITGWGSSGGLAFSPWPTPNTLNWVVCNQTASSITPGAATLNVGAR